LIRGIDKGAQPADLALIDAIFEYIGSFLNRVHHPKEEELIFPALKRRCPEAAELIAELGRQHLKGYTMMAELAGLLEGYESEGAATFPAFRDAVLDYIAFERAHVRLEEHRLVPLIRRHLTAEDQKKIDFAFEENEDPLFGKTRRKQYDALYSTIVRLAPEPYGLANRPSTGEKLD